MPYGMATKEWPELRMVHTGTLSLN